MVYSTALRLISCASVRFSNKTGFGPYRNHRHQQHFVGTKPSCLKYHLLHDKKPQHSYGLQGTNHLIKIKGKISGNLPTKVQMKKDKIYTWCSCGYSCNQPLCDGSHNLCYIPNLKLKPVRYIPDRDQEVWLCNCKQTSNRPFCDGSHRNLNSSDVKENLFN